MKMSECDICLMLKKKEAFKVVYEDNLVIALLHENPAILGHTLVIPKKHYPIFEEVPDELVGHIFNAANKVSTNIFDTIGAFGTNIIVNNGLSAGQEHAHIMVNVIPRKDGDKIDFEWEPVKVSDEELKTTQSMIKRFIDGVFYDRGLDASKVQVKEEKKIEPEEDYLVKQLKRVP